MCWYVCNCSKSLDIKPLFDCLQCHLNKERLINLEKMKSEMIPDRCESYRTSFILKYIWKSSFKACDSTTARSCSSCMLPPPFQSLTHFMHALSRTSSTGRSNSPQFLSAVMISTLSMCPIINLEDHWLQINVTARLMFNEVWLFF